MAKTPYPVTSVCKHGGQLRRAHRVVPTSVGILPVTAMAAAVQCLWQEHTRRTTSIFHLQLTMIPVSSARPFRQVPGLQSPRGLGGAHASRANRPAGTLVGVPPDAAGCMADAPGRELLARFCPWRVLSGSVPMVGRDSATRPSGAIRRHRGRGGQVGHPSDPCNGIPQATDVPSWNASLSPQRGWHGGTARWLLEPRARPRVDHELLEALMGPSKTRQQWGLPPTPEGLGRAAAWCPRDRETDVEIARRLGIGRRTLARWKH